MKYQREEENGCAYAFGHTESKLNLQCHEISALDRYTDTIHQV
jgi:hypothetical protein